MSNQKTTQAILVSDQDSLNPNQGVERIAFFFEEGGYPVAFQVSPDTGETVKLTGYTIGTAAALAATDTLNEALGKLEARVVALEG